MATRSTTMKIAGSTLLVSGALVATGIATPALAVYDCGVGAVAISGSVCELFIPASTGTFTPNSTMLTIEALLVAGGGGTNYYGGNGGEVQLIELNNYEDVTYTVGAGGGVGSDGEDTEINQGTVPNSASGGLSGQNTSPFGAPGTVASSFDSTLFTDDSRCFGGQGTYSNFDGTTGQTSASCGALHYSNLVTNTTTPLDPNVYYPGTGSATIVPQRPNSGAGGSIWPSFESSDTLVNFNEQSGADGAMIIRWSHVPDELPDTAAGQNNFTAITGAAVAATLAVAGASMLVTGRRRKS